LYKKVYDKFHHGANGDVEDKNLNENGVFNKQTLTLRDNFQYSYGEEIMKGKVGCDITVLLMDPRLPILKNCASIWFTLESVATFLPDACVLLKTGM
jgi:hypothetical protein